MLAPSSKDTTFMIRLPYTEGLNELGMSGRAVLTSSFNYKIVEWANRLFSELEENWKSLANLNLSADNLQNNDWILEAYLATWIHKFTNDMIVVLLTGERFYSMASYYNILSPVKVSRSNTLIEDPERFIQGFANHLIGLTLFLYPFIITYHFIKIKSK
ncbi:cytochrome P450 [Gigaspora margarita]|uniref:Cytochrome P450 n=1 Tax=Gigaspora margarita TaxID=4874 RepID=A0A8H4ACX7_GIGMA|nr:cytochrome P450 [Gigaspora margarita]